MPTEPGQQLLHYRLIEKIGEGGMGVVWKAEDTTLNRRVAIKLLPPAFSEDPERLARFEREAKLLASLNHVNIAAIYGIHRADAGTDTVHFLAMELIEGEDLAQRLARGALSRDDALEVALQIAHALEAAHESGVIHRDLKPANVKLTPNGQVKVLDFGLAKALAGDPSDAGASPSMSPTITSAGTVAGMILGTAAYMSPEQAKGKQVDRRADIWSFGVVLHEMLAGRRLFEGESISETLAAVILKDLDWSGLPADTPRAIGRLLRRCLQRDPLSRLRDMGDARIAIEEAKRNPDDVETDAPASARPLWATLLPWAVAAAAVAAALGWAWLTDDGERALPRAMRFTLAIGDDQSMRSSNVPSMAVSPDGRRFVYMGNLDGTRPLFLREIDTDQAVELDGTDGAEIPFFSPDGQWIGFAAGGKLQKVSIRGGPPIELCDARAMRGASWGADGTIVFAPKISSGLMRVSDGGGEPEG
jgi:serine/threonine-protein kinase